MTTGYETQKWDFGEGRGGFLEWNNQKHPTNTVTSWIYKLLDFILFYTLEIYMTLSYF